MVQLNIKTFHFFMAQQELVHEVVVTVGGTDAVQVDGIIVFFDGFHTAERKIM